MVQVLVGGAFFTTDGAALGACQKSNKIKWLLASGGKTRRLPAAWLTASLARRTTSPIACQ
jgi:hypothetical protein